MVQDIQKIKQRLMQEMEEVIMKEVDEQGEVKPEASLEFQALSLIKKATKENDSTKAKSLLEQAILIDPYCYDGYLLRAQCESSLSEMIKWYHQGMAVADKVQSKNVAENSSDYNNSDSFKHSAFYRLQYSYFLTLLQGGIYYKALEIGESYLLKIRHDFLDIRPIVTALYLMDGDDQKAREYFTHYEDEHISYLLCKALYYFKRRQYDSAKKALVNCNEKNPHFLRFLSGKAQQEIQSLKLDGYYEKVSKEQAYYEMTQCYFLYDYFPEFLEFIQQVYQQTKQ